MSGEKIYTGAEAMGLAGAIRRGDPVCDPGIADLAASVAHWEALARAKGAELDARAGRTTAPTDAEIAAHAAAGGVWLVRAEWREGRQSIDFVQSWAPRIAKLLREYNSATWWMALDATHMPCGWPTTEAPDAR